MIIAERQRIIDEEEDYRHGSNAASALSNNFITISASAGNGNNLGGDSNLQAYGTFSQTQKDFNTQFPSSSKNQGSTMSQKGNFTTLAGASTAGGKLPTAAATGTISNFPKFI